MKTLANNTAVYTDFNGLSRLKSKAQQPDEATLREVARQFEAMFFEMVLKGMREAKLGEGMFDSQESELYYDLFDKQLSLELTKQQGIGLADQLVRQLKGTLRSEPQAAASPAVPALVNLAQAPQPTDGNAQSAVVRPNKDWRPSSKEEFVRDIWPHAQKAGEALGVAPETLVAQAALESGWGQGMLRSADGRPSFNVFNIKADASWDGERIARATLEHENGALRRVPSAFRAYDSLESSFADYVAFVRGNPRYAHALGAAADSRNYIAELHRAGYATDPQYAQKVTGLLESSAFAETVARSKLAPELQSEPVKPL